MPDTALSNQLPPRTTTSTRWPRKWSTLGGRDASASTTIIPTDDSDLIENTSKTNGHHRHSTSLFRKSSTISRTNGTQITSDENASTSLKKSRSLMNVLRSKLHSPAVLRRFRSKSRESAKQTVTEINGHKTTDQPEIKESKTDQTTTTETTRKSRKREPSPMRRLANRITQFTRHQRTTSTERQKKSPSKSATNDSHEEKRESSSPTHNKDEVDHINACYDEIRAKYFNNDNTNKRNTSNNDTYNRSLLSNDILNNSQRINLPLPSSDDPLLQARKQSNIKLNCMLSGYSLTTSFANHEKLFGQNDLFKFHHYYDVGKRKYDYNFTSNNNRIFSTMKTRPISKSIDSFRRTNTNENDASLRLEKLLIVDNDPLVRIENHEDVPRLLPDDNELVIREDNDIIQSEQHTSQYTSNIHVTPVVSTSSDIPDENKINSNEQSDEEFERNFLRAVDRALGVVNKDENLLTQSNDDIPTETNESHLNLIQMTERALSSFNNSPLFTNDDQENEQTDNNKVLDHTDEPLNNEELLKVDNENREEKPTNDDLNDQELSKVHNENRGEKPTATNDDLNNQELAKLDNETREEKSTNDDSNNQELLKHDNENPEEKPITGDLVNEELLKVDNENREEKSTDDDSNNEDLLKVGNENPEEEPINDGSNNQELLKHDNENREGKPITGDLINEELLKVDNENREEKSANDDSSNQELPKLDQENREEKSTNDDLHNEELLKVNNENSEEKPANDDPNNHELLKVDSENLAEETTHDDSNSEDLSKVHNDNQTEEPTSDGLNDQEPSKLSNEDREEKPTNDDLKNEELLKVESENLAEETTHDDSNNEDLSKVHNDNQTEEPTSDGLNDQEPSKLSNEDREEKPTNADLKNEELLKVDNENVEEKSTNDDLSKVGNENRAEETTHDDLIDEDVWSVVDDLTQQVDESLFEESKNGQTFLIRLDEEEKIIKSKADAYNKLLQLDDNRLAEDVRTDINAVIGEVNLLLRGKLKQFRGLCESNVTKITAGEPLPLDSDLEGFWDITYPLTDKVKEKFAKLDARKATQWAPIEEYDPHDVNNRPRVIDDRLKQLQPQQNKSSKIPTTKSSNDGLKKMIQEKRRAAANATNQNHDIEIFVAPK